MVIHPNAHTLQPGLECLGAALTMESGQNHAGHIQTKATEDVNQPDHVPVVGDAQIAPDLILLDIVGIDGDDHLHLLF